VNRWSFPYCPLKLVSSNWDIIGVVDAASSIVATGGRALGNNSWFALSVNVNDPEITARILAAVDIAIADGEHAAKAASSGKLLNNRPCVVGQVEFSESSFAAGQTYHGPHIVRGARYVDPVRESEAIELSRPRGDGLFVGWGISIEIDLGPLCVGSDVVLSVTVDITAVVADELGVSGEKTFVDRAIGRDLNNGTSSGLKTVDVIVQLVVAHRIKIICTISVSLDGGDAIIRKINLVESCVAGNVPVWRAAKSRCNWGGCGCSWWRWWSCG